MKSGYFGAYQEFIPITIGFFKGFVDRYNFVSTIGPYFLAQFFLFSNSLSALYFSSIS
jgi:hypothetical protein